LERTQKESKKEGEALNVRIQELGDQANKNVSYFITIQVHNVPLISASLKLSIFKYRKEPFSQ